MSSTTLSPAPSPFDSASQTPAISTPATSPPPNALSDFSCASSNVFDEATMEEDSQHEPVEQIKIEPTTEIDASLPISPAETDSERRLARLQFVLQKSAVYSSILKERMEQDKAEQLAASSAARTARAKSKGNSKATPVEPVGKGRKRVLEDASTAETKGKKKKGVDGQAIIDDAENEREEAAEDDEPPVFEQPALITGAKMKSYQLEGLQWMVSLDQNGISGILADEMGLGKTLQTIAFSAYLREHYNSRPFLVVCPLSVLHNWADEYKKFAPDIPVCIYHGSPTERATMRRTVMALPGQKAREQERARNLKKSQEQARKTRAENKAKKVAAKKAEKEKAAAAKQSKSSPSRRSPVRRSTRPRKSINFVESDDEDAKDDEDYNEGQEQADGDDDSMDLDNEKKEGATAQDEENFYASFPIVLTTYEIIIKDRAALAHYNWGYIVVDEGHRLKNLDCKLMREIKKYRSAGRLILTGTPLHNNLAELWSLLNFILPDIFDDVDSFQEWFNLPSLQSNLPTSQASQLISALHAILKPFLLRRLKTDVEQSLPPKKEYVLYAPLSVRQREAYENVLKGGIRSWLIKGGTAANEDTLKEQLTAQAEAAEKKEDEQEEEEVEKRRLSRRNKGVRRNYAVDGSDDDEYFKSLDVDEKDEIPEEERESEEARIGREHHYKAKVKSVNNMRLQNTVMQLRKVCSHPFLFDWPVDSRTNQPVLGEELINASGKMMVLDRLLRELFRRKHKVLLFSQFTTMLDIIEDWATDYMKWPICRIDGSTKPMERREQMNIFQNGGDDAPCLFLLSTRAGGLGINLVAADTVIFYDQDWNPQMDAQAQDRAHRIGQKKPVLIFRLVSAHTIEEKIMQRATEKRKLEALVIAKGKFKTPAAAATAKKETIAEMAATLLKLEGEKIDVVPNTKEGKAGVLSDEDLDILLDRSPEVFAGRQKGWTSTAAETKKELEAGVKKAAFAVYEAPKEEGSDALAKMMGEEEAL